MRHPRETPEGWLGLCRCGRKAKSGCITCSICIEKRIESRRLVTGQRECMVCNVKSIFDLCSHCTQEMRSGEHQWQKRNRRAA